MHPDPVLELDISFHVADFPDDGLRVHAAAKWICQQFKVRKLSASIAIVDDPTIHELNREHLDHDWPTDVISFVFEHSDDCVDGEIIASSDTARKLCSKAGWRVEDEVLLYVIHGLLHLVGLDDLEPDGRREMRSQEQACLLALGVHMAAEHLDRWDDISY